MSRLFLATILVVALFFTRSAAAAIVITPGAATVAPRSTRSFTATNGEPPYKFTLANAPSGASLSPNGGYTAGAKGNVTDSIRVVDSNGDSAVAVVRVTAGLTITPAAASTSPRGRVAFTASGGSGAGIVWSIESGLGTIGQDGAYLAASSGTAIVKITDSLGNEATATVAVGAGLVVTPTDSETAPGGQLTFAPTGGGGVYAWSLAPNRSGGGIDGTGHYIAGPAGDVVDVVIVTDQLGNAAAANVHVLSGSAAGDDDDGTGSSPDDDAGVAASKEPPTTDGSRTFVNLAGGGGADNACNCGVALGAYDAVQSNAAVLFSLVLGIALFARRRRID